MKQAERNNRRLMSIAGVLAAIMGLVIPAAQADTRPALSGQVSSAKEGPMEGVLVSAKQTGSTITISVVSDEKGHFSFPASKIGPGDYALRIRAIGYDLEGPAKATVPRGKSATVDLKLRSVDDISSQMTSAEWIASVPGTEDQKKFLYNCTTCHSVERIVKSSHDANDFSTNVLERMRGYANSAWDLQPQRRVVPRGLQRNFGTDAPKISGYLASINLSDDRQAGATRSRRCRGRKAGRPMSSIPSMTFRAP